METTFITIHDLSLNARLLYVSSSVEDILGYTPQEVIGKSCWEYFHPDEIPFARTIHGRGVQLDKAAVLNYCQIKNKDGRWVGCECVFTIVHDVLVGCTSVYRRGIKSQKRAKEAPIIRQLFSSSPRDPRYHMLSYISQKFSKPSRTLVHEPRAALFLNRFSRTLTIMYATNGLVDALGITAQELTGKSFYFCIQENCLREAVKCLESAKANDSIAYLRFWFRDPRQDDRVNADDDISDAHSSGDEDETGGVHLSELLEHDGTENAVASDTSNSMRSSVDRDQSHLQHDHLDPNSRSSSGNSTDIAPSNSDTIFDRPAVSQSRTSSISTPDDSQVSAAPWSLGPSQVELEAVVSCTSDGLVVILRRAKNFVPHVSQPTSAAEKYPYANGFFASPWASDPILPNLEDQQQYLLPHLQQPPEAPVHPTATRANVAATNGPATEDFMNSIREVVVFAWSLTGINGSLEQYARGIPTGESQPPGGLPIWDPNFNAGPEIERPNLNGFLTNGQSNGPKNDYQSQYEMADTHGLTYSNSPQVNPYAHANGSNGYNDPAQTNNAGTIQTNGYLNSKQRTGYSNQSQTHGSWMQTSEQGRVWDVSQQPNQSNKGFDHDYDKR